MPPDLLTRLILIVGAALIVIVITTFIITRKAKLTKQELGKVFLLVVLSIIWMLFIMFLLEHIQEKYNIPIYNEIFDEEYDNSTLGFIILFLPHIIYLLRYIRTKRDS